MKNSKLTKVGYVLLLTTLILLVGCTTTKEEASREVWDADVQGNCICDGDIFKQL